MDYDMAKSNAQSLADGWNKAVYIAKSYLTGDYCLLSDNKKLSTTFRVIETVIPHTCKDGKRGQMNITTYKVKQYNATSKTVVCINDKPVCMAVGGKTISNIIAYLNGYNVDIADGKIKKVLDRCKAESRKQEPCTLDDAREDFMFDVYNILDFLPTNNEANQIIDVFDRVTSGLKQESVLDKIKAEVKEWYWQADKQALAKDPCVVDAMDDIEREEYNSYMAESEDKE